MRVVLLVAETGQAASIQVLLVVRHSLRPEAGVVVKVIALQVYLVVLVAVALGDLLLRAALELLGKETLVVLLLGVQTHLLIEVVVVAVRGP